MSNLPSRLPSICPAPAGIPDICSYHTPTSTGGGAAGTSLEDCIRVANIGWARGRPAEPLQLHDLFLFGLRDVVDHRDVLVGEILDLLLTVLALVLGDLLVLLGFLHQVHRIAARRAHGHARLLGLLADA